MGFAQGDVMTINDGGPAFPVNELDHVTGNICAQHVGLSLRDYFAAKAMTGIVASDEWHLDGQPADWVEVTDIALFSYQLADAMMKAREAK
jgi:hypothetical protein